jgi:hypothetical protein
VILFAMPPVLTFSMGDGSEYVPVGTFVEPVSVLEEYASHV